MTGRSMTEDGPVTARQDGGEPPPLSRENPMTDRIDPAVNVMEKPPRQPAVDHP